MGAILVTGATGKVGRALVARLRELGESVRVATRGPPAVAPPGAPVIAFDLERPDTFPRALEGADRVFLVARPGDLHPERVAMPFIAELARRGVRRVVDLSAMGIDSAPEVGLRKIERHIEASGIAFTHLRANWFMQNFSSGRMLSAIRVTGAIRVPAGSATISFVDVRDVAAVAATALTDPRHAGQAYDVTGEEALDHASVARMISEAARRPVRYEPIGESEARTSSAIGELSLEFYRLVRAGVFGTVAPTVRRLAGRPAISFAQFAQDEASAWT